MVFAPLMGLGLLIAVLVAREQLGTTLAVAVTIGGISIIAAIWSSLLASRRLAQSLEGLRESLQGVAEGDYALKLSVDSRALVEPVAAAIDAARTPLQRRFHDLEASRDQLRTVLNSMVEGVVAVDDAQRVLLVNDSACRMFRLQESAAVGRPLWEQVRNHRLQELVARALTERRSVEGELEMLAPISRVLQVHAVPLPSEVQPGAVVVAGDVSELRRLEKVRQEFVANASHELKTPLASMKLCLETLLEGAIDDLANRDRFLTTANEQADRMDQLISDLLALTKIESAQVPLERRPLSVSAMVQASSERYAQLAEHKQIHLSVQSTAGDVIVFSDDRAVEQVLDNLLDNAIKYTNSGGQVRVYWQVEPGKCLVSVEDTGIGIPLNQKSRIFERFYRVDSARSRELGGTGLGLSIVKHLVNALDGTIDVKTQLGKGTTFTFSLPLAHSGTASSDSPREVPSLV